MPGSRTARRLSVALAVAAALPPLVLAACGGEERELAVPRDPVMTERTTSTVATTTVPEPEPEERDLWPLTGLPAGEGEPEARAAIVVKIDNDIRARPHVGLDDADIVYEVMVEGITRFGAVYHSREADPVGPIRSARSSDVDLVGNLHRPLLVWSGANAGVTEEIRRAHHDGILADVSHTVGAAHFWRERGRPGPFNLFTTTSAVREHHTNGDERPPTPLFSYRDDDTEPLGTPVPGARVDFGGGNLVDYVWDAEDRCWRRFDEGPFVGADGRQACPENVVVQWVAYDWSSGPPVARTVGGGEVRVLTAGRLAEGRWERPIREFPAVLLTDERDGIGLTRGRTWVALPREGTAVTPLSPSDAAALLADAP